MTGPGVRRLLSGFVACALLAGCATPSVEQFAGVGPAFDPVAFFTGHVTSWGVIENRSGQPIDIITTDCHGTVGPDGVLHMVQALTIGKDVRTRTWDMQRIAPGRYEATASDMVGRATADVAGRALHWQYTLILDPNNALKNVTLEQWMYLMADGSMVNRDTIRKLGIIGAGITEHFTRAS